jgi:hypothetical protein
MNCRSTISGEADDPHPAGVVILCPDGWSGVWDVHETYAIVKIS